jgi:hypothetical protein
MDHEREALRLFLELPEQAAELFDQCLIIRDIFTLFKKLPLELRLKIWKHSFPTGRTILVDLAQYTDENGFQILIRDAEYLKSTDPSK